MALEGVIYQQDPLIYGCIDYNYCTELGVEEKFNVEQSSAIGYWESSPPLNATSSAEARRKRRRSKTLKNKEELETQRMTHIAVERNRRRQMNDYLAVLRSLMPPSYAQRGDQASIVGGAINFVKELEQLLQFLEAYKLMDRQDMGSSSDKVFRNLLSFPQYSGKSADIEVTMVETHASIKILAKKMPKQLLKMVAGFQSFCLNILHLNITTLDQSVLYSFSVKVCFYFTHSLKTKLKNLTLHDM
uniref:Basic helix-loop-helix transcription factor n=1 Tax=Salvia miltiorrhiza TaxID=226208 RepID=A0A0H3YB65_SALMI|nr:basic helix-loop-helix transcription factor [Salvia miltiorrhiza]